jgi:RluA family pseudouridine synthase
MGQMGGPDLNPDPGNNPGPEKGPSPGNVPRIVDRDDDVLVLDKPAGLLTQPGPTGGPSLLSWLEEQGERPYLIHRLDREASGLLVLARRREACAPLQAALAEGSVERRYLAVVQGRPAPEGGIGRIELRITVQQRDRRLRAALPREAPGGKEATTLYRIVQELPDDRTLLSLQLLTGRTHQIRVHLSAIGHPIVGDAFYGGAPHARLLLHAQTLRFPHPFTQSPKEYTLPPGADFTAVAAGPP